MVYEHLDNTKETYHSLCYTNCGAQVGKILIKKVTQNL